MSATMILDPIDQLRYASSGVARRSSVRLTRRGRVVVFALALLAAFAVALVGASVAGATSKGGQVATHTVAVTPGLTLWEVASQAAHGRDVVAMEQRIEDLNGLDADGVLVVGQHLRVPN